MMVKLYKSIKIYNKIQQKLFEHIRTGSVGENHTQLRNLLQTLKMFTPRKEVNMMKYHHHQILINSCPF